MGRYFGTMMLDPGVCQWTETYCDSCGVHDESTRIPGHHQGWPLVPTGWVSRAEGSLIRVLCPGCATKP